MHLFVVFVTPLGFKPKTFRTGSGDISIRILLIIMILYFKFALFQSIIS